MGFHKGSRFQQAMIGLAAMLAAWATHIGPTLAEAHASERTGNRQPGTVAIPVPLFLAQAGQAALRGCWRATAGRNSAELCFTRAGSGLRASVSSVSVYGVNRTEQCQGQSGPAALKGGAVRIDMPRRDKICLRGTKRTNAVRRQFACRRIGSDRLDCTLTGYNWDNRTVHSVRTGVSFTRVR